MPTKMKSTRNLTRELDVIVYDSGPRKLMVTIRPDGTLLLHGKRMRHGVMWQLDALFEKGVKEGRRA